MKAGTARGEDYSRFLHAGAIQRTDVQDARSLPVQTRIPGRLSKDKDRARESEREREREREGEREKESERMRRQKARMRGQRG
jgi:hypothetical protein